MNIMRPRRRVFELMTIDLLMAESGGFRRTVRVDVPLSLPTIILVRLRGFNEVQNWLILFSVDGQFVGRDC